MTLCIARVGEDGASAPPASDPPPEAALEVVEKVSTAPGPGRSRTVINVDLLDWAEAYAGGLLGASDRWAHSRMVAEQAWEIGSYLPDDERLIAKVAGLVHDIGYAESLHVTGCHHLDGAHQLRDLGRERLSRLVARHSTGPWEAEARGLLDELAVYPAEHSDVADLLTFADMTTSPSGEPVSFDDRVAEIVERYGQDDIVSIGLTNALPELRACVERVGARRASTATR